MTAKRILIKAHQILASQFGLNPCLFLRSLRGLPVFLRDWRRFRQGYFGRMVLMPCLHDRYEEGGITKSEYFWQDLLVARWIHEARPEKHVDVGSRVDGFVAHLASFREVEVFDVRPITTHIPGVMFKQVDLTRNVGGTDLSGCGYCDSLSCLHALEHFGLGRYGDPIDSLGHERGLANMVALLKSGGTLYLSTPVGCERVEFNANRVFDPRTIIRLAEVLGLMLRRLTVIDAGGNVRDVTPEASALRGLAEMPYNLGIFTFYKE